MNPAEVVAHFPEEQIYEDWMGGNLNDALLFHGLIFLFNGCNSFGPLPDSEMDQFVVKGREDVYLWGRPMSFWSRDTVTYHLDENNLNFYVTAASNIEVASQSLSLNFTANGELLEVAGGRLL